MNSRSKTLIIGGLVGGAMGALAAWLYMRTAREDDAAVQAVPTGKMVRLGLSIMEVLRQVTTLGEREEEGRRRGRRRES